MSVSEDRSPEDVFANPRHPDADALIHELADTKIFTERQAEVYVSRELEAVPRQELAENLGYDNVSSLDTVHQGAKRNASDAEWVIELLDHYRSPPMPEECDECGAVIAGRWIETDSGDVYCDPTCAEGDS